MYRFRRPCAVAISALATTLCASAAFADGTLVMNGKTASTAVRTIGGSAFVKLSDVAKALGMVVVKRPGGYEIVKPGGANQALGVTQGKIGDVLFDGRWRFQTLKMEQPDAYTMTTPEVEPSSHPRDIIEFNPTTRVLRAKAGYKLVVLKCRMSNGQKTTQTFWLAQKDGNNGLADSQGESHAPVGFDIEGAPIQSKPLLPGARTDFAMLFCVPKECQVTALVFTLHNNDSSQKPNDVRVSLTGN